MAFEIYIYIYIYISISIYDEKDPEDDINEPESKRKAINARKKTMSKIIKHGKNDDNQGDDSLSCRFHFLK